MDHATLYMVLAVFFGFIMAWGVGANDVANAMGTAVGSRALTLFQAVIIATIFESLGALLAGGEVTTTIRSGIIDASVLSNSPDILVQGMLASLLAAGSWLVVASIFGWPVSTTHSIVGAILGFGLVVLGVNAIYWHNVFNIASSWVVTPIIAGVLSFALFRSVQVLIFETESPIHNARIYVPIYVFIVTMMVSMITILKGLAHVGLALSGISAVLISLALGVVASMVSIFMIKQLHINAARDGGVINFTVLEKIFGVLMAITACSMAFAHGSNDVANAIGPLAAVVSIVKHGGDIGQNSTVPVWILALGAVGIVSGLIIYGHRVIATIGSEITQLTPSRGFAAQLATASTVVFASGLGLPVSTTQTLVGAILGIGFARGMGALNVSVIRNIFLSWIVTLPAGAVLAIIYYYLIHISVGLL